MVGPRNQVIENEEVILTPGRNKGAAKKKMLK
jgi:hypothetical protein